VKKRKKEIAAPSPPPSPRARDVKTTIPEGEGRLNKQASKQNPRAKEEADTKRQARSPPLLLPFQEFQPSNNFAIS